MLLALRPDKFVDNLCKMPPGSMAELCERPEGYIQMEEMSKLKNEVRQVRKKHKCEANTKTDLHKSDKRHKPDKHQPLPKGPRHERYTPLTTNHTTILEEAFNLEVPIRWPPTTPPWLGSNATKYYRYHHDIRHNTEDCCTLKDMIEELI